MSERIREESLIHTRRRLFDRNSLGNWSEPRRRGKSMGRVGISHKNDAISWFDIVDVGTQFRNEPTPLAS